MTTLDAGILILIGLAGIACYRTGFTRAGWGIFVISIGIFIAAHWWTPLAAVLGRFITNPTWAKWVSLVAIAGGVALLMDSLFERIHRIFETGILGWVNALLGFCFGAVSAGVAIAFALIALSSYAGEGFKREIAASRLAPHLAAIGHHVWETSKTEVQKRIDTE